MWYRASLLERPKYNSESQWNTISQNLIKQLYGTDISFTDFYEGAVKYSLRVVTPAGGNNSWPGESAPWSKQITK